MAIHKDSDPSRMKTYNRLCVNEFLDEMEQILQWWLKESLDKEYGGFYGEISHHGETHKKADKCIIIHTRLLWSFASAARHVKSNTYLSIANQAYSYLTQYFLDPVYSGVYWSLNYIGEPSKLRKQIYGQAFAIYSLSEYYLLTHKKEALDIAMELFWLIEKYSRDEVNGGYYEAFSREWTELDDVRLSDKDKNESKTMNTHLHILEAYTLLYEASEDKNVAVSLSHLLGCFHDQIYNHSTCSLNLFLNELWQAKSSTISFGHNIEASWLLHRASHVIPNHLVPPQTNKLIFDLAKHTYEHARSDQILLKDEEPQEKVEYIWWAQAEGIIGFYNMYERTQLPQYLQAATDIWKTTQKVFKDKYKGEWHWGVDKELRPLPQYYKAGAWKAPYHNVRLCIELSNRLQSNHNEF